MSFFNFYRHIAFFFDDNGEQVGYKVFKRSFSSSIGLNKKTFDYDGGSYNINPKVSKINFNPKGSILFNNKIYLYYLNNPEAISLKDNKISPLMDAKNYQIRLKSNLIEAINRAGRGKMNINWKAILITIGVLIFLYFIFSGGNLTEVLGLSEKVTENSTIIDNSLNLTSARV